ncbi:hypothetical protein E6C27_scaffold131G00510 [Cucumis melo var. makuwa]|uniref:Uncharacterized protein n=1 Tax=Cucumis melo var. makuwa TaxID=1194695 RepID=A0A5A7UK83_CUCMM|nr:hypothetical protein E6C27_scaffold131G00510 [Cucumis melo var. makuwa]
MEAKKILPLTSLQLCWILEAIEELCQQPIRIRWKRICQEVLYYLKESVSFAEKVKALRNIPVPDLKIKAHKVLINPLFAENALTDFDQGTLDDLIEQPGKWQEFGAFYLKFMKWDKLFCCRPLYAKGYGGWLSIKNLPLDYWNNQTFEDEEVELARKVADPICRKLLCQIRKFQQFKVLETIGKYSEVVGQPLPLSHSINLWAVQRSSPISKASDSHVYIISPGCTKATQRSSPISTMQEKASNSGINDKGISLNGDGPTFGNSSDKAEDCTQALVPAPSTGSASQSLLPPQFEHSVFSLPTLRSTAVESPEVVIGDWPAMVIGSGVRKLTDELNNS